MKTEKLILKTALFTIMLCVTYACQQDRIDPAVTLDQVFVPKGYVQNDNAPEDAMAQLTELRLENPADRFYYLKREDESSENWVFPQKELKIESVIYPDSKTLNKKNMPVGVIVKKIKGDYRDEEFIVVEKQPVPKDGLKAFYEYIGNSLKYPENAKKEGVKGKVFVEFVVDEKGALTEVKVVRGIGSGCNEEAVRVLKQAPAWNPGMVVEMPVKVKMILPINYQLG